MVKSLFEKKSVCVCVCVVGRRVREIWIILSVFVASRVSDWSMRFHFPKFTFIFPRKTAQV